MRVHKDSRTKHVCVKVEHQFDNIWHILTQHRLEGTLRKTQLSWFEVNLSADTNGLFPHSCGPLHQLQGPTRVSMCTNRRGYAFHKAETLMDGDDKVRDRKKTKRDNQHFSEKLWTHLESSLHPPNHLSLSSVILRCSFLFSNWYQVHLLLSVLRPHLGHNKQRYAGFPAVRDENTQPDRSHGNTLECKTYYLQWGKKESSVTETEERSWCSSSVWQTFHQTSICQQSYTNTIWGYEVAM